MSALLKPWAQEDIRRNLGGFVPEWKVKTPTIFTGRLVSGTFRCLTDSSDLWKVLILTTPPNSPPTLFHRDAYMPSVSSAVESASTNR